MKPLLCLYILLLGITIAQAQTLLESQYKNVQTLEEELSKAKTSEEKTDALISLYLHHALHSESVNKIASIEYQKQLEIYVHKTNEPELIAKAFLNLTRPAQGEEKKKRIDRLYDYAKSHNLTFYKAAAKIREAEYYYNYRTDPNKATQLVNEGINLSKDLNDSLRSWIYYEAGDRLNSMNNPVQALQLAFRALEIATKINSLELLRRGNNLCAFVYFSLKNYNKSIEYHLKTLQLLRKLGHLHFYARNSAVLARHYFTSEQAVLGEYHIAEAYRMADSLKGSKRLYNEITGNIINALTKTNNKLLIADFLKKYSKYFFIVPGWEFKDNVVLARAYFNAGEVDSAKVFLNRAQQYFSDNETADDREDYFFSWARNEAFDKNPTVAIINYKQSLKLALAQNDLNDCIEYTDSLKTILAKQNAFQEAFYYSIVSDSLQQELSRQQDKEDVTRQEVAAIEKEKEMLAIAKLKEKQQRHNLQYLGITFGVVALFITLLLMGLFKVSTRTIKILSFFSFLLFFEFIFLIFKKQIAVITNGEPLMDLGFMVLLAAVMVPLHHWGEKKVVHYLSTKKFSFLKINKKPPIIREKELVS